MSAAYELARAILEFVSVLKRSDMEWQTQRLDEIAELKRKKYINNINLENEIKMLKQEWSAKLLSEKYRQEKIVQDYKNFLDSIEEVKQKMLATYPNMPKPMVLLIHHHAKGLLDDMWRSQNKDQHAYEISQEKFTRFFMTIFNDATARLGEDQNGLPTETIKLITNSSNH